MTTDVIEVTGDTVLVITESAETIELEGEVLVVPVNEVEVINVAQQGPIGPPGTSAGIEIDFGTLIAAATATIDSVLMSTERCATWQVCVETTGGGKSQTWTVVAVNDGGTAVNHVVFGKVRAPLAGGPLSITTVVDISAGDMRLRLTNNEAFSVDISVTRISISP